MIVKFKKLHENAVIPLFGKPGDAGADLTCVSLSYDEENDIFEYDSGISVEIPSGYFGLIVPRSSIFKTDLFLTNHAGVIDSGYRGSIKAKFKILQDYDEMDMSRVDTESGVVSSVVYDSQGHVDITFKIYPIGSRFAQLIIQKIPEIEYVESSELSETERGEGGYGSTGV
jgi:dUTP pyrophosphatase